MWEWPTVAAVSFAAGMLWRAYSVKASARRAARERCAHEYGPVKPVNLPMPAWRRTPEFWVRFCVHCGQQMHCNEDGSEYRPRRD